MSSSFAVRQEAAQEVGRLSDVRIESREDVNVAVCEGSKIQMNSEAPATNLITSNRHH